MKTKLLAIFIFSAITLKIIGIILTIMKKSIPSFLFALVVLLQADAHAQWSTNPAVNTAITNAIDHQSYPVVVSDGFGGAIITWQDNRNGSNSDIYAQRINSAGVVQWTTDGIAICTATGDQILPAIASDGLGGAFITWTDKRSVDWEIYAQHINSSGVLQWIANGLIISNATSSQRYPGIISDGSGGAIISWEDSRSGVSWDIYAQRISSTGTMQWTSNGVAICNFSGSQLGVKIVSDSSGGAIISWMDLRNGIDNDIYAQKLNAVGIVQWTNNGVAVCSAPNAEAVYPRIVSDGSGGVVISWEDTRNSNYYDVYAQRVDAKGTIRWSKDGIVISKGPNLQENSDMISDGLGGTFIVIQDRRNGIDWDIYIQHIDSMGVMLWPAM